MISYYLHLKGLFKMDTNGRFLKDINVSYHEGNFEEELTTSAQQASLENEWVVI
jgi:hypothetical protein